MSKEYEITYCTAECLEQTINILKEISKEYKWENEQESKKIVKNVNN